MEESKEDNENKEEQEETSEEEEIREEVPEEPKVTIVPREKKSIKQIYEDNYKKLLIIPFVLLGLALLQIGFQYATTGDFVSKGISLKGGVSITVPTDVEYNSVAMENYLLAEFPGNEVSVRTLTRAGYTVGIVVDADIDAADSGQVATLVNAIGTHLGIELSSDDYTIEGFGSSLGTSFFRETSIAILISFLFMGLVVFIYFRALAPSFAVILAAFSDIIVTVAIANIIGIKFSTAGIAALLMLIGYSVDTDILLSTRLLKRKEGSVMSRIYGAMRTGLTMNGTTLLAVTAALIFTQSEVISQIMTIIIIGLLVDIINTWIQNVGLLRMHIEKKNEPKD